MFEKIKTKAEVTKSDETLYLSIREPLSSDELDFLYKYVGKENLNIEMTKANLTEDDKRFLEESKKFIEEMNSIPESEKEPVPENILDRWQSEVG